MKTMAFILPFLVLISFSKMSSLKESKFVRIAPESTLEIKGTSNVTNFTCVYNILSLNQPIPIHYENKNDMIYFENAGLVLKNSCFDCGGRGINKDFNGLLQSESYPHIVLNLKELKKKSNSKNTIDALIEIQIAGISKIYTMETQFHYDENWHISGILKLNIKDFDLAAPKKMLGLIVVSEEIEIRFNLVLEEC